MYSIQKMAHIRSTGFAWFYSCNFRSVILETHFVFACRLEIVRSSETKSVFYAVHTAYSHIEKEVIINFHIISLPHPSDLQYVVAS